MYGILSTGYTNLGHIVPWLMMVAGQVVPPPPPAPPPGAGEGDGGSGGGAAAGSGPGL